MRDGRYLGDDGTVRVDLRVDVRGPTGRVSGDVFRVDVTPPIYVASFVTPPPGWTAGPVAGSARVQVTDAYGRRVGGSLSLAPQADPLVVGVALALDADTSGLAAGTALALNARWTSESLRALGVELEVEQGVPAIGSVDLGGRAVTLRSCLEAAGYAVRDAGLVDTVPRAPPEGWQDAQLHGLMVQFAQAEIKRADWSVHVLLLSRSVNPVLFGLMFDESATLPRQGCAVFADTVRESYTDPERALLQTTLHEVGHVLNLAHSFHWGRADSATPMNYDWTYSGGVAEYWANFRFQFDRTELTFLRHGRLPDTVPGGSRRGSADGRASLASPFGPRAASEEDRELRLWLEPPTAGPLLVHGQPVFLSVTLQNLGPEVRHVAAHVLDVKAGRLQVGILRRGERGEAPRRFRPVTLRCLREDVEHLVMQPGQNLHENVQLTFGADGFPFAEPGEYEVFAVVDLPASDGAPRVQVRSNVLRLRVAAPMTLQEERDALVLLRPDVGLYFALGGSDLLVGADEALGELVARRAGKRTRVVDPASVGALRAHALNAAREFPALPGLRFERRPADPERAARTLGRIGVRGWDAFDDDTCRRTRAWGDDLTKAMRKRSARRRARRR